MFLASILYVKSVACYVFTSLVLWMVKLMFLNAKHCRANMITSSKGLYFATRWWDFFKQECVVYVFICSNKAECIGFRTI
jgi:uncharacterized membrane protein YobD (UPF0266 family)